MTDLHDLLHQAAGGEPPRFTVEDVRRRVRRRRMVRRGALVGVLSVVVLVMVASVEWSDGPAVQPVSAPEVADLGRRWRAIYSNELGVAPEGSFLELRGDGTFSGSDGCNSFAGRYTVRVDRMAVLDLSTTKRRCAPGDAVELIEILRADPTVRAELGALGTLRLWAPDKGYVAFEAAELRPGEGMIETEIVLDAPGGTVRVRFLSPRTISAGEDRLVVRIHVENHSTGRTSAWTKSALQGLPAACALDHPRWEELEPDLNAPGPRELFPQLNLDPGDSGGTTSQRDVPEACKGDFTLVLLATSDPVGGDVVERRVPITVR